MDVYRTEEEQVEAMKKWWRENGKSVIFGVILGLGAIFGWREWHDYSARQAEEASSLYQEMIVALRDGKETDKVRQTADLIVSDYGSTTYALFASMTLAKLAVSGKDYQSAASHLQWALENSEEESLTHLIRLRLARVLMAQEKFTEALELLDQGGSGEFGASYDELRGDILKSQGDLEAARDAYQQALAMRSNSTQGDVSALEMKLEDLGRPETQ